MSDTDPRVCRRPGADPDWWFAPAGSPEHNLAKTACLHCPLYWECQQLALREGIPHGIFGGMSGRDREKVWKTWPEGRPKDFEQVIDANSRPLLQARRDEESFELHFERAQRKKEWHKTYYAKQKAG